MSSSWGSGPRVLARLDEPPPPPEDWPVGGTGRFPGAQTDGGHTFVAQGTAALVTCLLAALALAAFIAATPWLRAYQVARAPLLLALAAILPVAIAGALSRALRVPPLISYGGSLAGLALLLGAANDFNFSAVWNGLVHVPAQLLTETLPLSGQPYLLSAPVVLTWLCGAVSAELSVRPVRPAATAALVPIACFVFAFVFTTSAPIESSVAQGAALLGDLMLWALARHAILERQRALVEARGNGGYSRSASVTWAAAGAAMAVLLAAALTLAVPGNLSVAGKAKSVSRPTPVVSTTVVDPVDSLAAMRRYDPSAPPKTFFTVTVDEPWSGYLPVAELDNYDGDSWSFTATFRPTGGRVPSPAAGAEQIGTEVKQHYTLLHSFGLPFLPALDRPVQVTGLAVDADATTGMLAATPSLPATYSVVSRVAPETIGEVSQTTPFASGALVPGGDSPSYTDLPAGSSRDIAEGVRFSATLTRSSATPSLAFMQSLAQQLRVHERRVVPARAAKSQLSTSATLAGTSLAQVINAVTVDRAATPEQFATFYAVVARYLGVRARVVTGFRVPVASDRSAVAAGSYTLTDRDTWTWVEVPVVGVGWVIVDPTPAATTTAASPPPEQVRATPTTVPRQATALPGNSAAHAIAKPSPVPKSPPLHVNWALVLGIGIPAALVIGLLAGGLLVPAVRRRLRRVARHQPGDPSLLAAGAWLEFLDGLSRLGLEVSPSATSNEVADQVADRFGEDFGPPTRFVGAAADQALYSTAWPVEEARAQNAWDSQRQLYKAMRHTVGFEAQAQALLRVGTAPARPSQRNPHPPEMAHAAGGGPEGGS
jgi:TgpA N-terminal domain/Transglutaminase-like superfamily